MLRKSLIAATAAAVVAVGGLTAIPSSASAANVSAQSGAVVEVHYKRGHHGHRAKARMVKVCKPVFRKVVRYDRWHRPRWTTVKVGHRCHWVPKRSYRVRRWH